ncbi:MAG: adenylosuccinate lyase [Rhodobacteraceae bacterium]|nr:adenylosuccinate lyase [Paracoccaceae bacterium]
MLNRYSRDGMASIWSQQEKLRIWFRIEAYAAEAMAELDVIPDSCAKQLWASEPAEFDVERLLQIEREVQHESLAFQMYLEELMGTPEARFVHRGLTSSDVLDTCTNYQLKRAADLLIDGLSSLARACRRQCMRHRHTVCIGRSHGVHGEPVTFGLKMARAYAEFSRNLQRMRAARTEIAVGKVSGAMGTFADVDPFVERYVCERLGLVPEPVSSQIVPRDRHATFFLTLSVVAASLERLATELRQLQMTEVAEVHEAFGKRQKGSSAMPHKRNPILSENVCGLARIVRANCAAALDNVPLWHERDMSHSSVERAIAPDATATLDFALWRMKHVVENLMIDDRRMKHNLELTKGRIASQRVMLMLTDSGVARNQAYRLVQACAFEAVKSDTHFREALLKTPEIVEKLSERRINQAFDCRDWFRHVDLIVDRVFAAYPDHDDLLTATNSN